MLTGSKDYLTARKYWNKLKQRLKEEGNETVTNCHQLKIKAADGKMRLTDVADMEPCTNNWHSSYNNPISSYKMAGFCLMIPESCVSLHSSK